MTSVLPPVCLKAVEHWPIDAENVFLIPAIWQTFTLAGFNQIQSLRDPRRDPTDPPCDFFCTTGLVEFAHSGMDIRAFTYYSIQATRPADFFITFGFTKGDTTLAFVEFTGRTKDYQKGKSKENNDPQPSLGRLYDAFVFLQKRMKKLGY